MSSMCSNNPGDAHRWASLTGTAIVSNISARVRVCRPLPHPDGVVRSMQVCSCIDLKRSARSGRGAGDMEWRVRGSVAVARYLGELLYRDFFEQAPEAMDLFPPEVRAKCPPSRWLDVRVIQGRLRSGPSGPRRSAHCVVGSSASSVTTAQCASTWILQVRVGRRPWLGVGRGSRS